MADDVEQPTVARLTCGCGQEYEIRDGTPQWAAPWFVCPECFLMDGEATPARKEKRWREK